jgi:hypothetical protein
MANHRVVRARSRIKEARDPMRRALAALSEVLRYDDLSDSDIFGRVHVDPKRPEDKKDLDAMVALAQEDYPDTELEVIIVIAGGGQQREGDQSGSKQTGRVQRR